MRRSSLGLFDVDTREPSADGTALVFRTRVDAIRNNLNRLFTFQRCNSGLIAATACLYAGSVREVLPTSARFVRIRETGIDWLHELRHHREFFLEKQHLGSPECNRCHRAYDVFRWNPNAQHLVQAAEVDIWCVFGVSLEYCVRATVGGLISLRQRVVVLSDAVVPSQRDGRMLRQGLRELAADGATIVPTAELLRDYEG